MHPVYSLLMPPPAASAKPAVGVYHKPWEHTLLKVMSWGAVATAGLALAPVVFPAFSNTLVPMSDSAIRSCVNGPPTGLAGHSFNMMQSLGLSAGMLNGGLATVALSGGIALGGLWLANYVDKRTKQGEFRWGSVIRWTALATSFLIALPSLLTAISMGLNFFGLWSGSDTLTGLAKGLGSLGAEGIAAKAAAAAKLAGGTGAVSGAGAAMGAAALAGIHALTCALPLGVTGFFLGQKEEKPVPQLQLPAMEVGCITPPPVMRRVATA